MDVRIVKHACTAIAVAIRHMGALAPQATPAAVPATPQITHPHDVAAFFIERFFAVLPARAQRLGGAQA